MTPLSRKISCKPRKVDRLDVFAHQTNLYHQYWHQTWICVAMFSVRHDIKPFLEDYNICMISSSNFFKKTFFTIEQQDRSKKKNHQLYGPWEEEGDQALPYKSRKSASKNRYVPAPYSTLEEQNEQERPNRTQLSRSLLLTTQNSLIEGLSRRKSVKQKKNKIIHEKAEKQQTKLPAIKINESQNESLRKSILKLEGGLLNFITSNNQKSLKKFVSKRDDSGPKFEMYKKCLLAARRMMQEGQHNTLFYGDS